MIIETDDLTPEQEAIVQDMCRDVEMQAIMSVLFTIKGLPVDARQRVIAYITARFKPG